MIIGIVCIRTNQCLTRTSSGHIRIYAIFELLTFRWMEVQAKSMCLKILPRISSVTNLLVKLGEKAPQLLQPSLLLGCRLVHTHIVECYLPLQIFSLSLYFGGTKSNGHEHNSDDYIEWP